MGRVNISAQEADIKDIAKSCFVGIDATEGVPGDEKRIFQFLPVYG